MTMRITTYKCKTCGEEIYSRCTIEKRTCSCGNLTVKNGTFQGMTWVATGIESNLKRITTSTIYLNVDWKTLKKDFVDKTNLYGIVKEPVPVPMVKDNGEPVKEEE